MATANARGGRRRWMLHEDARAGIIAADEEMLAAEGSDGAARRYVFGDRSASFAVASRLLPQRLLSLGALLAAGIALVAGLAAANVQLAAIRGTFGITHLPAAQWSSSSSIGAWFSNLLLTVAGLLCLLVYGLRRHRLDDYRGKYRRWLTAAVACVATSLVLSTGLHHTFSEVLAARSGIPGMLNGAIWWLFPVVLIGGWIATRVALDMRPCRLGLFSLAIACGAYLAALAANFALLPAAVAAVVTEPVARCIGHVWLVVALLAQTRFILLEASGQIAPSRSVSAANPRPQEKPPAKPRLERTPETNSRSPSPSVPLAAAEQRQTAVPRPPEKKSLITAAKSPSQWVDGRNSHEADDEDDDAQSLSKAERKRLRKEQFRNRAA